MESTFVIAGVVAILAAIAGGGLKAFGIEVPILVSLRRQLLLGFVGLILLLFGLRVISIPTRPSVPPNPRVIVKGWASPEMIAVGEGTAINVSVMTERSTALSGAIVSIHDAGTGRFSLSGTGNVEGMTDDRGQFQAFWAPTSRAHTSEIVSYEMQARVTKDGVVIGIVPIAVRVHR